MGLFGKKKVTLMLEFVLFEDFDHQRPDTAHPESLRKFGEPIVRQVYKKNYVNTLEPGKWNYHYDLQIISGAKSEAFAQFDFRDPETKEIASAAKYKEFTDGIKSGWKKDLQTRFPKYKPDKMEDAFENIKIDYFPEDGLLVESVLLEGVRV